ncbi:MAG: CDP-archaeol synthase [Patescibacteria group bacterium]|nr:CDP-archaeol synthase [Patescibacteria group bacterium]
MLENIIDSIWFFLPAAVANMTPVLVKWVPFLNYPISRKYLGDHKTYRGFFFGILIAMFIAWTQHGDIYLGFLLGFGALSGDSVKSFFKRRMNIRPGKSWYVFDQIDWILGASLFATLYVEIEWIMFLSILVVFSILHVIANAIRVSLKL